jgi:putative DNA primase/helicase
MGAVAGNFTAPYAKAALDDECGKVAGSIEGARNDTLNKAAFSLGTLVGGGGLDEEVVRTRLTEAAQQSGLPDAEIDATIKSGLEAGKQQPRTVPNTPPGFVIRSDGLWYVKQEKDGDPVETWIDPPLHVLGATRDKHSNAWGLFLEWCDPDERKHRWAMPKSLLVGKDSSSWLGRLTDEGWSGAPGMQARKLLEIYLSKYRPMGRILCVPRTGWHDGVFVLPDAVIGDAATPEEIVLQPHPSHNPFQVGGTPDAWQSTIGTWAVGNSRLVFSICASLAPVLLEPLGHESFGFNLTGGSSIGKTTALLAAGSVWGKGSSSGGYVLSWRATDNGLESIAALHSDAA